MKLEEAIKYLNSIKNNDFFDKQAIETVLKEIEYVKNDKEKAMEILRENSIGRYKRDVNGIETYIIAVEDLKKILNLIDTQEIKLKNSIPKKKIEDKIQECEDNIINGIDSSYYLHQKIILQKLLEDK